MLSAYQRKERPSGNSVTDYFHPELICHVTDEEFGELGCLVIDRTVGTNPSGGGIRFAPGVTTMEIAQLARSMTLKFAFLNLPTGGAKAGITFSGHLDDDTRKRVITAFGKHLRTLLKRNVYFMGEDLGINLADLNLIQRAIGNPPYRFEARKKDAGPTGMTVFESVKRCAAGCGLQLRGATAVIEGMGRIGSEIALLLAESGVKVLGVSTGQGAIFNENGFDTAKLVDCREQYGDYFVNEFDDGEEIPPHELITMKTDILVPCARTWTINPENAHKIRAGIIVSGANGPVSPDSEQTLFERGILLMPDFVSSCGTILHSAMASKGFGDEAIKKFITGEFSWKIGVLLEKAGQKKISPLSYAREIAWRNFERMDELYSGPVVQGNKENCLICKVRQRGASGIWDKIKREFKGRIPSAANRMRREAYEMFVNVTTGGIK